MLHTGSPINLTGTENLRIFAELHSIPNRDAVKNALDLEFSRFRHLDLSEFQKQEYAAILLLIDLLNFCGEDAMEYKCIENTEFESYFHTGYDYQAKECAVLSNVEFCDELQRLYDSSFERFQYYEYEPVSKNPKVIEKLKKQYPVLQSYLGLL